jgi:hypothetical protein
MNRGEPKRVSINLANSLQEESRRLHPQESVKLIPVFLLNYDHKCDLKFEYSCRDPARGVT